VLVAVLGAAFPFAALAQTADDLKNEEKNTGDVLGYGMGQAQHRYSPLTQINRQSSGWCRRGRTAWPTTGAWRPSPWSRTV
jgi:glucose dehydrogenase